MTDRLSRIGRRFPDYGWSWPTGKLDQLLKAALWPDDTAAFDLATGWLDENDIDLVSFREHRLLAAISDRFGRRLSCHPAYPRLAGLQKMLWTRSRMAMREAEPALQEMAGAGCAVMLIKGASRIAVDAAAQRGRVAHDIDILVRPRDMAAAFEVLRRQDWQVSTGVSPQYLRTRLGALRSMNFFKGGFGDLDLHQFAYDTTQASPQDDLALWDRALPARFAGLDVLVPSAADRIALAIAHGGLDAHTHSDWLVDCAVAVWGGDVDWDIFLDVVDRRGIAVPAAVALSYLALEIGVPISQPALQKIVELADKGGFSRWSSILQAKPRTDFGSLVWLSRGVAKQLRLARKNSGAGLPQPSRSVWRSWRPKRAGAGKAGRYVLSQPIPAPDGPAGVMMLDLRIRLSVPPVRRRIEMEINAGERHIARLRSMTLMPSGGEKVLHFRGPVPLSGLDLPLVLEARPSRQFREWNDAAIVATYGALPFQLLSAEFSPVR